MTDVDYFAVILAGGSGARFWPMSREAFPKQMLQVVGEDTLLRQTIKRIQRSVPSKNTWVVTTRDKVPDIRFHLEPLGPRAKEIQILAEPIGRNTAPAIGLAAIFLHRRSPESIMIVMPSDHAIPDDGKFIADLEVAVRGAEGGHLVTFGIRPNRPETGYGYIKVKNQPNRFNRPNRPDRGNELDERRKSDRTGLLEVDRFLEKPDLQTAKIFSSKEGYFWNSGIFVWKASKILSEIERHLPRLYKVLEEIESRLLVDELMHSPIDSMTELKDLYSTLDSVSIDYGVMERSSNVLMVPATFQWSDLGSWAALDEVVPKDHAGNILRGNIIDLDSRDSIVLSETRLIATIGLKDMAVVDTPDATLVIPKERAQEVRKIVEILRKKGREEHLIHRTVGRPWGSYTVLERGYGYKIKRIVVTPGARLSLQRHSRRSEHWVVVSGTAKVTKGNEAYWLQTNESTFIPVMTKHRLENQGDGLLQIIEVQSGDYVEEDDIERFDDDYARQ